MSLLSNMFGSLGNMNGGGKNVAEDYLKKQQADKQGKIDATNRMKESGFSDFRDGFDPYIEKYGKNSTAGESYLSDVTSKAYAPLQQSLENFGAQAPVTANVDPAFRDYQLGLAQQLQQQASGQGPSLAQLQLQQATNQGMNNSLGLIRASSGVNGALGARTAALAGSQMLGNAGNQSAMLRLQEQQQAQNALASVAGAGRNNDVATTGLQARTALDSRGQQLDAMNALRPVIGDRISGTTQVLQGGLGLDAAGIEAKRQGDQTATARRHKQQDGVVGAASNIFSTLFS